MTFEHQGLLFGHDNRFHEVARERLRSARAAGAHTFLVLSPHRASVLIDELPPDERARVRVLAHEELYDAPGRTLAALHRMALTHSPSRVTVIAEPPRTAGSTMELREWHRLESVLATALAPTRMTLLCAYDERGLSPAARKAVVATHPTLIGTSGPRPNPGYLGTSAFGTRPSAPEPLPVHGPVHRLEIGHSLPLLRRDLNMLCTAVGLSAHHRDSLTVAVNELSANVLEHGAGKGSVSLWRTDGRWVCDVFDEGGELSDPLTGYRPVNTLRPRGYGLWIARQSCDFLEICGDRTETLIRLHFLDPTPASTRTDTDQVSR